jgi:nitrite reductase (cytochrome c-552)
MIALGFLGVAGLTVLLLALLTNIFERKQEARQPFVRVAEVTEETMDPKVWAQNWPYEYDSYLKTAAHHHQVRRPRTGSQRRWPRLPEARPRSVAQAHLRRLRLRARLS